MHIYARFSLETAVSASANRVTQTRPLRRKRIPVIKRFEHFPARKRQRGGGGVVENRLYIYIFFFTLADLCDFITIGRQLVLVNIRYRI